MIGVALAMFYFEHGGAKRTQPLPLSDATVKYGRIIALIVLSVTAFGTYTSHVAGIHILHCAWGVLRGSLYFMFTDLAWSLSMAFLILLGLFHRGGLFTRVLALDVFTPLGRLVYTVYLTHFVFILTVMQGINRHLDWSVQHSHDYCHHPYY